MRRKILVTWIVYIFIQSITSQKAQEHASENIITQQNSFNNHHMLTGPLRYQYSINILVKFNYSFHLKTFNNSQAIYWALTRYVSNNSSHNSNSAITLPLFNVANKYIRENTTLSSEFDCYPSNTECNEIALPSFKDFRFLGSYSYQSFINTLDSLFVNFNVSTYRSSIEFGCSNIDNVKDNCSIKDNDKLTVLSNKKVQLSCSIIITQNAAFQPSIDFLFQECISTKEIIQDVSMQFLKNDAHDQLVWLKYTKSCIREFNIFDNNSTFSCELISRPNLNLPRELALRQSYEKMSVNLDVHYGLQINDLSNDYNKTALAGSLSSIHFSCPYESNPYPVYFWRLAKVNYDTGNTKTSDLNRRRLTTTNFLESTKDYAVPYNLEEGQYIFECVAKSLFNSINETKALKFHLSVLRKHLIKLNYRVNPDLFLFF
jgi:hypothetical protein